MGRRKTYSKKITYQFRVQGFLLRLQKFLSDLQWAGEYSSIVG